MNLALLVALAEGLAPPELKKMNLFVFVGVVNDKVIFGTVDGGTFDLARQKLEAQLKLRDWSHCRFTLQQLTAPFQMGAVAKAMFDDAPTDAPAG